MFEGLAEELCDAATTYHTWWRQKYAGESVYAYGFFTPPCVEWAGMVVFTEEGLRRVASEYRAMDTYAGQSIEALMEMLRWSPADSPHCMENGDIFGAVNERLADISLTTHELDPDDPAFDVHIGSLYECLISALRRFRSGPLAAARQPLLSVWFGDQSEDEILHFIRHCNDDATLAWYLQTRASS